MRKKETIPTIMNPFTKSKFPVTFDADPKEVADLANHPKGHRDRVMTRSDLRKFSLCPRKWLLSGPEDATRAMDFGSLVDSLILTPQHFDAQFAVAPALYPAEPKKKGDPIEVKPWNWNANHCKAWRDKQEAEGRVVVKTETRDFAKNAAERLLADDRMAAVVKESRKQALTYVDYKDQATGLTIPIRCLIDLVPKAEVLGDVKTAQSGAPHEWVRAVFSNGYAYQAAFYLDAYNAAAGTDYRGFVHLIVENEHPFETARRTLSAEFIEMGREQYQADLRRYAVCLAANDWPGYDDEATPRYPIIDGWRLVEPEPWMVVA